MASPISNQWGIFSSKHMAFRFEARSFVGDMTEQHTCFRCRKVLPEGVTGECNPPCDESPSDSLREFVQRQYREFMANSVELDWEKMTRPDDLKLFVNEIYNRDIPVCDHNFECVKIFLEAFVGRTARINKLHPVYQRIKQFCKSEVDLPPIK
jgi:hypothetical protein